MDATWDTRPLRADPSGGSVRTLDATPYLPGEVHEPEEKPGAAALAATRAAWQTAVSAGRR